MARQITQQTFDDVVRENMTEFEMSAEEAVQDAIQQFESQDVNLSIIIKDPSLFISGEDGSSVVHPIVLALSKLSSSLEDPNHSGILESLHDVQKECDIDLSHRCLAGTSGAYPIFFKALSTFSKDPELLKPVLSSFCSLVNGQPDLLDNKGVSLLIDILKLYKEDEKVEELIVRAIRFNCIKHEGNRLQFVELDLILLLTELLSIHKSSPSMVKEICVCLRTLTLDDDVRVPFGKAHEHAKMIVTDGDALKAILQLCKEHVNNLNVLAELFLTLSCLAVRDEFCQEVMNRGGLQLIIQAFQKSVSDKVIVRQALIVLKALAGNDEVKIEIRNLGGVELVFLAMTSHQAISSIADAACRVLTAITLRNVDNCRRVIDCEGHQHIIQAMKLHPNDENVQKNACMALRNLVARCKEFSEPILAVGAESLLNQAMTSHKDVYDEAKAALRDLGCKVDLKELWKGERGTIS